METAIAIAIRQQQTELQIRRSLQKDERVQKALTKEENLIFYASCQPHIDELIAQGNEQELTAKISQQLDFIALEVGYKKPSSGIDWQWLKTRIYTFIKTHYRWLSLADMKYAFDALALGNLDEYLPRNAYGTPDRSHYQSFTPEYFAKVLNAYKQYQSGIVSTARNALPAPTKAKSNDGERYWDRKSVEAFYIYKYRGVLKLSPYLTLHILKRIDKSAVITETDKKKAFYEYLRLASKGMKNENEAVYVKRKGIEAQELQAEAQTKAEERVIKEHFDSIIKEL